MNNSSDLIAKAITEAKSGNRLGARVILAQVVRVEPGNAQAWYLLSRLVEEKEQIIYCLNKILEITPDDSQAKARLKRLQSPPTPESPRRTQTPKKGGFDNRIVIASILIGGLCFILFSACFGLYALGFNPQSPPKINLPPSLSLAAATLTPQDIFSNTPEIEPPYPFVPTDTPFPTPTLLVQTDIPSAVPTEILPPGSGENLDSMKYIAKNYLGSIESNGVIVELARVIIGDKETLAKEKDIGYLIDPEHDISRLLQDSRIVVEVIFKITNNTDRLINLDLSRDDAMFILNGVQIPLNQFLDYANLTESFRNGNIDPQTSVNGGFWLPTSLLSVYEANTVILGLPPAYDENNQAVIENSFIFADVVDWGWEDIPEEFEK